MRFLLSLILLSMLQLSTVSATFAAAGVVTNMSGVVFVKQADGKVKSLFEQSEFNEGDIISTEKNSYVRLKFKDGGELTLRPETTMKIDRFQYNDAEPDKDSFVMSLVKGGFRTITGLVGKRGNRDAYKLQTATATIGIRGTVYGGVFCTNNCGGIPPGLYLEIMEGAIHASNGAGGLDFTAGQFGFVDSFEKTPVLLPVDPGIPAFDVDNPESKTITNQGAGGSGCIVK